MTSVLTAIYVLCDPRDCMIRYVGKSVDPKHRLRAHRSFKKTKMTKNDRWLADLLAEGIYPKMRIVEWTSDWETAERKWISVCRATGRCINNTDDGGVGSFIGTKIRRSNRAFLTYRKVMAHLSRQITSYVKDGKTEKAESLRTKFKKIRKTVAGLEARGGSYLEVFYERVHEHFGTRLR